MQQCTTPADPAQVLPHYPKVSYRLLLAVAITRDARNHGVNPMPALAAAHDAYRASGGNRFHARRAGWAVVDAQCGRAG